MTELKPHNVDAEGALLGALLMSPDRSLECIEAGLAPADFFIVKNGWVYAAITALALQDAPIDILTIWEHLKAQNQLGDNEGLAYISSLAEETPAAWHAVDYAKIIHRTAQRRALIEYASDIARRAYNEGAPLEETIEQAEYQLRLIGESEHGAGLAPLSTILSDTYDRISAIYKGEISGLKTGFKDVDTIIGGLFGGDLMIVAARPGVGKTNLLLNIALNNAWRGRKVAFFSTEMSEYQIAIRLVCMTTQLDSQVFRGEQIQGEHIEKFAEGCNQLAGLNLFVDDSPALSSYQLASRAHRMVQKHGQLDLIAVDYLQLMSGTHVNGDLKRHEELDEITRGLKRIGRELNVPVIGASQLNRSLEQRADKRPTLSDLKESGSIEENADLVTFIYRGELYEADATPNIADVIVAKNRFGPTGVASLFFRKHACQFVDAEIHQIDLNEMLI